jgi:putative endonuclease
MFFVYILKSKKDEDLYLGYTPDLRKRLKEHNLGLVRSTKLRKPLSLVYYESYASKQDAVQREHNLKLRAKALRQLKNRIKNSLKA